MTESPIQQIADALANEVMRQLDRAEEHDTFAAGKTTVGDDRVRFKEATIDLDLKALATVAFELSASFRETDVNHPKNESQMLRSLQQAVREINALSRAAETEYGMSLRLAIFRHDDEDDDIGADRLGLTVWKKLT